MSFRIETGLTAAEGFIDDVYEIDKIVYSAQLCGVKENMVKRHKANKDTFLLIYDDDTLVGYFNFFPVSSQLYDSMVDRKDLSMRDDDIAACDICEWSTQKNNVLILSLAVLPQYRNQAVIIELSNRFLEFLREKSDSGYPITSICGYAVSLDGVKFLKRIKASLLKTTTEGYHFFFANRDCVDELLEDGYTLNTYKKSYEDDIYFFIPMTSHIHNKLARALYEDNKRSCTDEEDFDYTPTEDLSKLEFGDLYCKVLNRHIEYECDSETFKSKNMSRVYLGEFKLACYDDDYDGIALDTLNAHLFVTIHKSTGLYIVTVAVPENKYNSTQLIDQMSTGHLEIFDKEKDCFVKVDEYINRKYGLSVCGESKCIVCMSNKPDNDLELPYLLSGETMVSKHIDYHIREERLKDFRECRAVYDYYESYISRSVIAFVFHDYDKDISVRMSDEASEIFIVEIVMFQNTAVLRTNRKVVRELEDNRELYMQDIDELYIEFGKTIHFWNTDVFKYPCAQIEADEVVKSFGIKETLEDYRRNQNFLERLIELKSNIVEQKSNRRMNNILFFLSCIESCSITLGAVLWIWGLVKNPDAMPSFGDIGVRVGWIFFFVICSILIYMFTSWRRLYILSDDNAYKSRRLRKKNKRR